MITSRIQPSCLGQALITAIGAGVGDEFDVTKARYHKVTCLADADVEELSIAFVDVVPTVELTLVRDLGLPAIATGFAVDGIIASGLVACTPLLTRAMNMKSYYALLTGGMTVSTASQLIGDAAILYYRKAAHRKAEIDASAEIKDLLG